MAQKNDSENAPGANGPVLAPAEGFSNALCVFWGLCLVPVAGTDLRGGSSARPPAPPDLGAASNPTVLGALHRLCIDGGGCWKGLGGSELPPWQTPPVVRPLPTCILRGHWFASWCFVFLQEKNKGTACTGAGRGLLSQTSQLYTKVCSRICTAVNNYNCFL